MIYGSRVRQAREIQGLTQVELANLIGVKQAAISQVEKDEFSPSSELLRAIAIRTGFLPSFFEKPPVDTFPIGSLNYRARKNVSARETTKAYQYAKILYEQARVMLPRLNVPKLRLPQVNEPPDIAARMTRSNFGLSPDTPIQNLMNTIEKNGIFVFSLPLILPNTDAFSTWAELDVERPIVAVSSGKPTDRLRFNIAHELGHLVMRRIKGDIPSIEKEANSFAGEFLLPEITMRQELLPPLSLAGLARLKVRWGVSMQALIYRARELRLISERQAKYLFTQMSAHGWRTREPANLDIRPEVPRLLRSMIETTYKRPEQYANDMGLTIERATEFYIYA